MTVLEAYWAASLIVWNFMAAFASRLAVFKLQQLDKS